MRTKSMSSKPTLEITKIAKRHNVENILFTKGAALSQTVATQQPIERCNDTIIFACHIKYSNLPFCQSGTRNEQPSINTSCEKRSGHGYSRLDTTWTSRGKSCLFYLFVDNSFSSQVSICCPLGYFFVSWAQISPIHTSC